MVPQGDPPYIVGQVVTISIQVNTGSEEITGLRFYLTLDPDIFRPVLIYDDGTRPFIPGDLIGMSAHDNHMHGDSLHLGPDGNGIDGWQLDYFQQINVGASPKDGSGTGATFAVEIIDIPSDPLQTPTLSFEDVNKYDRRTGYTTPNGTRLGFSNFPNPTPIEIAGLGIRPVIPDTIITPGSGLDIYMGDHFSSNIIDSADAIWSRQILNPVPLPTGASFDIIPLSGPTSRLIMTTGPSDHFILDVLINLEGTDTTSGLTFYDQQPLQVVVDYVPVFDQPLPDTVIFDEDVPLRLVGNGIFFTDLDDFGTDLQVRLEPDTYIHVSYTATDSIIFYADANWFGSYPARLFVEDALGVSADTLLTFTVNSINDPPVVSFDSVSVLGDTLVIHRATPDTLALKLFVTDVDDPVLTWSVNNPDPINLSDTLLAGDLLRLEADSASPFIDIALTLTATDDSLDSDSDILVVSIRSWPPVITILDDIKILAGVDSTVALDDWVSDNDTPDSDMIWSFEVVDYITKVPDPQVSYTYDQASQTVIFNTPPGYAATDLLILTVQDDDSNVDVDTTRLTVFDSYDPVIYPLDTVVVYRDTSTQVLDLDDYVVDPIFSPDTLTWTIIYDGDSLKAVTIDNEHVVTIETDPGFFGWDSVIFVVTNPDPAGYSDTSTLVVRVIPRYDGPPVWYSIQDTVENVYPYIDTLFILTDVCKDDFTPGDQLNFTPFVNPDLLKPLNLDIDPTTLLASISVPATGNYTTWFYFSAEDAMGQVSNSDTVQVLIKDSYSPVWLRMPTVAMYVNETYSGLILQDFLSDKDTPPGAHTITLDNPNPRITVTYNATTTEVTIQASGYPTESTVTVYATDPQGNTARAYLRVIVMPIIDLTPPAGGLTYFFNPAADKWIHYVVVADNTTDINRFIWYYHYGVPAHRQDYSNYLSFALQDTLPGTLTWIAPYHFQNEGSYSLTVEIIDAVNNMLEISPVSLSVGFSKAIGGVLTSPDRQLTVSYPPAPIPNGKLLIISEDSLPVSTGLSIAKTLSARGNEENGSQVPAMVYSLDTNLPEPILVTLTYHQKRDTDPYYSFYELDGDQLVKIETYTSADGHFEAAAKLDRDIVFAPSDAPARDAPLPGAELFCYPNPFNATIQVRFLLRWQDQGRIVIYNLLGREVYASPRQPLEPGMHAFSWHSIDKRGLPVPSGTYFIRLETDGGKLVTRKVTLLK